MIPYRKIKPEAEVYLGLSEEAMARGDVITAIVRLNDAIDVYRDPKIIYKLAEHYMDMCAYDEANRLYCRLFAKNTEFDQLAHIFEIYSRIGNKTLAKEFLSNTIINHTHVAKFQKKYDYREFPELQSAIYEMVGLFDGSADKDIVDEVNGVKILNKEKRASKENMDAAVRYFMQGDCDRAIEFALMVKKTSDKYPEAAVLIIHAAIIQEDFDLAKKYFYEVLAVDPLNVDLLVMAYSLKSAGVFSVEYIDELEDKLYGLLIKAGCEKVFIASIMLDHALKFKRYDYVKKLATHILKLRPANAEALKAAAIASFVLGEKEEGEKYIKLYSLAFGDLSGTFVSSLRYTLGAEYEGNEMYDVFEDKIPPKLTLRSMIDFLDMFAKKLKQTTIQKRIAKNGFDAKLDLILRSQVEIIVDFVERFLAELYSISPKIVLGIIKNILAEGQVPLNNKLLIIRTLLGIEGFDEVLTINTCTGFLTIKVQKPMDRTLVSKQFWFDAYKNAFLDLVALCHMFDVDVLARTAGCAVFRFDKTHCEMQYVTLMLEWAVLSCTNIGKDEITDVLAGVSEFDEDTLVEYVKHYLGEEMQPKYED